MVETASTEVGEAINNEPVVVTIPVAETAVEASPAPMVAAVEVIEPAPTVAVEAPATETAPVAQIEVAAEAVQETVTVAEIAAEPATPEVQVVAEAQVEIPVIEQPAVAVEAVAAPAPLPASAPINVDAALSDSGLVMVQTTAEVPVAPSEPPVKLGRPRKAKAVEQSADEPLVMVETGK